jgi:uncharacterized protein
MRITELYVHPLKGAAPVPVDAAALDAFGLQYDRRWMIVDAAGEFLTQRNQPLLALLGTGLEPDALVLRSQRAGEARLPLRPEAGPGLRVRVWDDEVDAIDAGEVAAAFISAHLGTAARVVHMPDTSVRQVDPDYAEPGDRVGFADAFPLLVITQESLDELNHRLAEPVPMLRFRPNIVVAGSAPHAEDEWRRIRLGTVSCDVVKPCARCAVTTIDAATATSGPEPLRTLATYRRWNGKVWFGQNVLHRGGGVLHIGDRVEVLETGAPRPPSAAVPVAGRAQDAGS